MRIEIAESTETVADSWEGCSAGDLASHLRLPAVHLFATVGSTNDVARRLAQTGAPSGTLVISEEQRVGRGRGSRSWASAPGLGLWISFLARGLDPAYMNLLPIEVALEAAAALDGWTAGAVRVKWPNDLILGGRKLGGILCEASWDGHRLDHVVIGLGLNLLHSPEDFPESVRSTATSLRAANPRSISRFQVATAVIEGLRVAASNRRVGPDATIRQFASRDALIGLRVRIRDLESPRVLASGIASGIDESGALLLREGGEIRPIRSGTVEVLG